MENKTIIFFDEIKLLNDRVLYIVIPKKYEIAGFKSGKNIKITIEKVEKQEETK